MILRRLGNKKAIAHKIIPYFTPHKIFIDVFFGAGGMFFNKPKAKYNIVNDLDSDVFNLFQVVMNQKEELDAAYKTVPIHSDLLDYWKENKETDNIKKALRFLFLSNFTFMGKPNNIKFGTENPKNTVYDYLNKTFDLIHDVQFLNKDFRVLFNSIQIREADKVLIYCDPPYIETDDNYSNSFTEQDCIDLLDCLKETECKFAYSEFDNPFILEQAKQRGLNVIIIGERQNLKNRRTEILVTNYKNNNLLFD